MPLLYYESRTYRMTMMNIKFSKHMIFATVMVWAGLPNETKSDFSCWIKGLPGSSPSAECIARYDTGRNDKDIDCHRLCHTNYASYQGLGGCSQELYNKCATDFPKAPRIVCYAKARQLGDKEDDRCKLLPSL